MRSKQRRCIRGGSAIRPTYTYSTRAAMKSETASISRIGSEGSRRASRLWSSITSSALSATARLSVLTFSVRASARPRRQAPRASPAPASSRPTRLDHPEILLWQGTWHATRQGSDPPDTAMRPRCSSLQNLCGVNPTLVRSTRRRSVKSFSASSPVSRYMRSVSRGEGSCR